MSCGPAERLQKHESYHKGASTLHRSLDFDVFLILWVVCLDLFLKMFVEKGNTLQVEIISKVEGKCLVREDTKQPTQMVVASS